MQYSNAINSWMDGICIVRYHIMIWGVLHGGVTENPSYDYLDQMYSTFVVPLNAKTIILITQSILDLIFTCPNK